MGRLIPAQAELIKDDSIFAAIDYMALMEELRAGRFL